MSLSLVTNRASTDASKLTVIKIKYSSSGWSSLTETEKNNWRYGFPVYLLDAEGRYLIDASGRYLMIRDGVIRGAYNYTDLNRVESAVEKLAAALTGYGYPVSVTVKADWTLADVQAITTQTGLENIERYRENVAAIRAALTVFSSTPDVPDSMLQLGYQDANDIEQILLDVEILINNMVAIWFHSGEDVQSGEEY